jgi:hypothetical protein
VFVDRGGDRLSTVVGVRPEEIVALVHLCRARDLIDRTVRC